MGNFYANVTLKGPDPREIAEYLKDKGCQAFISPTVDGVTTVYEARCDMQDVGHIKQFTADLSKHLNCPALAVLNHDDDVLAYWLYEKGEMDHHFDSDPTYFIMPPAEPRIEDLAAVGDANVLIRTFGIPGDQAALEQALSRDSDYVFTSERHAEVLRALGLPGYAVATGFRYLENGEFPNGLDEQDFLRV